ncbi:MBL fold metallo-hydrolase [candidate division WOR-3 bacterium]|nr:MBL fold metallo-hydrolase [candidate division WOR-3 bacterium]
MKNILDKQIPKGAVGIWWLGQGGFIFKTFRDKIIFVDPYLSDSVEKKDGLKRMVGISIKPEEVAADFLLCTHDHLDHTDPETLYRIDKVKIFIGPSSVVKHYKQLGISAEKIIEINQMKEKIWGDVKIFTAFARHTEDSVGYIFNFNGITVYITGDTEYDEKLKEVSKFKPDIMLVCINGKWGNMNYKEAALLTKNIDPKLVIPMHYGMFKENTANPKDFIRYLEKLNFKGEKKILESNECFLYRKDEK